MECKKCSCAFFDPNPFRQNVCKNCQHPRNEHAEKQTSQEHSTRLHYIEVAAHKEKDEKNKECTFLEDKSVVADQTECILRPNTTEEAQVVDENSKSVAIFSPPKEQRTNFQDSTLSHQHVNELSQDEGGNLENFKEILEDDEMKNEDIQDKENMDRRNQIQSTLLESFDCRVEEMEAEQAGKTEFGVNARGMLCDDNKDATLEESDPYLNQIYEGIVSTTDAVASNSDARTHHVPSQDIHTIPPLALEDSLLVLQNHSEDPSQFEKQLMYLNLFYTFLQQGVKVIKLSRNGKSGDRIIWTDESTSRLYISRWKHGTKSSKGFKFCDIIQVGYGACTEALREYSLTHENPPCFALFVSGNRQSWDFVVHSEKLCNQLCEGFKQILVITSQNLLSDDRPHATNIIRPPESLNTNVRSPYIHSSVPTLPLHFLHSNQSHATFEERVQMSPLQTLAGDTILQQHATNVPYILQYPQTPSSLTIDRETLSVIETTVKNAIQNELKARSQPSSLKKSYGNKLAAMLKRTTLQKVDKKMKNYRDDPLTLSHVIQNGEAINIEQSQVAHGAKMESLDDICMDIPNSPSALRSRSPWKESKVDRGSRAKISIRNQVQNETKDEAPNCQQKQMSITAIYSIIQNALSEMIIESSGSTLASLLAVMLAMVAQLSAIVPFFSMPLALAMLIIGIHLESSSLNDRKKNVTDNSDENDCVESLSQESKPLSWKIPIMNVFMLGMSIFCHMVWFFGPLLGSLLHDTTDSQDYDTFAGKLDVPDPAIDKIPRNLTILCAIAIVLIVTIQSFQFAMMWREIKKEYLSCAAVLIETLVQVQSSLESMFQRQSPIRLACKKFLQFVCFLPLPRHYHSHHRALYFLFVCLFWIHAICCLVLLFLIILDYQNLFWSDRTHSKSVGLSPAQLHILCAIFDAVVCGISVTRLDSKQVKSTMGSAVFIIPNIVLNMWSVLVNSFVFSRRDSSSPIAGVLYFSYTISLVIHVFSALTTVLLICCIVSICEFALSDHSYSPVGTNSRDEEKRHEDDWVWSRHVLISSPNMAADEFEKCWEVWTAGISSKCILPYIPSANAARETLHSLNIWTVASGSQSLGHLKLFAYACTQDALHIVLLQLNISVECNTPIAHISAKVPSATVADVTCGRSCVNWISQAFPKAMLEPNMNY